MSLSGLMFLRSHQRSKDGKDHRYWSLVETVRTPDGPRQRTLCYLGELNGNAQARWLKTIEVFNEQGESRQLKLFPAEVEFSDNDPNVARVLLKKVRLERTRQFGNCFLGLELWKRLGLDRFYEGQLDQERAQVGWSRVAAVLAINRLCAPGSELSIEERWYPSTALDDLLGIGEGQLNDTRLYRCLDRLLPHKKKLEQHLKQRYGELFGAEFDVLLYDLTSSYVEGAAEQNPLLQRGYSRDHRPDCKQLIIALIVNVEGFPFSYETMDGDRADVTTLETMLQMVERKYGKARRVWVFDRGIVSEENLAALRKRGGQYLVGTPRKKLKEFEQELLAGGWERVRPEVEVKLVATPAGGRNLRVVPDGRSPAEREGDSESFLGPDRGGARSTRQTRAGGKAQRPQQDRAPDRKDPSPPSPGGRFVPDGCGGNQPGASLRLEAGEGLPSVAATARGRLPAEDQSAGWERRTALEPIHPTDGSRGGVSCLKERAVDSSALSSARTPREVPCLGGFPGLRALGDAQTSASSKRLKAVSGQSLVAAVKRTQH